MPTAETLRALIALVEEAKAGSPQLDVRVLAIVAEPGEWSAADIEYACTDPHRTCRPQPYTTSIDAALALVAKVLPGQDFTLHSNGTRWAPGEPAARIRFEPLTSVEETAPTLPLAILAALLRALLQQSETSHVER